MKVKRKHRWIALEVQNAQGDGVENLQSQGLVKEIDFRVNQPPPPKVLWQRSLCSSTASSKSRERTTRKYLPLASTLFPIKLVCHIAEMKIGLFSFLTPNPPTNPLIYIFHIVSNHFYFKSLYQEGLSFFFFNKSLGAFLPTINCLFPSDFCKVCFFIPLSQDPI